MDKQSLELAIGYCRVSTKKQEKQGLSLDAQEDYIKNFVSQDDFGLVKVFKVQESGGDSERKHLNRAFAYCIENDIKHILISDSDRWTRSRKMDVEAQEFIKEHNLRVHILRERRVIGQFGSAAEELSHNMKVDVDQFVKDSIKEKILEGIKKKLKKGEYPGSLPIGYKSIRKTDTSPHMIEQTDAASKIKRFLEDFSTGKFTLRQAVRHAKDIGLKPKTKDVFTIGALAKLIKNRFYYGKFEYSHEWINNGESEIYTNKTKGFKPIITKKIWQQNQETLKKRQKNLKEDQGRGKSFRFNQLMVCGKCERVIFGEKFSHTVKYETKKGLKSKKYEYPTQYHCTKGNFYTAGGEGIIPKEYIDEKMLVTKEDITYIDDETGEEKIWLRKGQPVEAHVCDMPRFSEDELEVMLMDKISLIKFNTKHWNAVKKSLFQDETKDFLDFEIRELRTEQTKNEIKLDKMYDEYEKEIIDAEFFKTRSSKIRERQEEIKERLPELEEERELYDNRIGKAIELLDSLKNWDRIFKEATDEKKNRMLDLLTIKISTSWRKTERRGRTYEHKGLYIELVPEVRELFELGILEASEKWDKENKIRMPSFNSPKISYSRSDH
ncbi:MAG: recombinase family protein [Candidatus Aminicenantaceae bacterium]